MPYDNTNRGSIWKNKRKEKDTHPDFTGSINVDGAEYWLNAWRRKEDASPESPAMTFTVRPKDQKSAPQRQAAKPSRDDDMDDSIPF